VEYLFRFIRDRFENLVLMFCRVRYWFESGSLCLKLEGPAAAPTLLPSYLQPLVYSDVASYAGEHIDDPDEQRVA
jgi:hypothetical protein